MNSTFQLFCSVNATSELIDAQNGRGRFSSSFQKAGSQVSICIDFSYFKGPSVVWLFSG